MLPFDERDGVYETLAMRALATFGSVRIPLSAKFFLLLLTEGNAGLASCIGISIRTLHRLLRQEGLSALELRTWGRREGLAILSSARRPHREIAPLIGFSSVATLQAFLRREFSTTSRSLRSDERHRALSSNED